VTKGCQVTTIDKDRILCTLHQAAMSPAHLHTAPVLSAFTRNKLTCSRYSPEGVKHGTEFATWKVQLHKKATHDILTRAANTRVKITRLVDTTSSQEQASGAFKVGAMASALLSKP